MGPLVVLLQRCRSILCLSGERTFTLQAARHDDDDDDDDDDEGIS